MTGISGGASFAVAIEVAEKAAEGSLILCMLADSNERYMTKPLFENIAEEMSTDEKEISFSTPNFQMR